MPRQLQSIYVFLVENAAGDEGVASYARPGIRRLADGTKATVLEPMIAVTEEKLKELRAVAADLVGISRGANGRPLTMRVVRFTGRVHVENVVPPVDGEPPRSVVVVEDI